MDVAGGDTKVAWGAAIAGMQVLVDLLDWSAVQLKPPVRIDTRRTGGTTGTSSFDLSEARVLLIAPLTVDPLVIAVVIVVAASFVHSAACPTYG